MHFDLLLEDIESCRTWRLNNIPIVNGPAVQAVLIAPHKLYWLEREEAFVSGGRGWAKRVVGGEFLGHLPFGENDLVKIQVISPTLTGCLEIVNNFCKISSS